MDLDRAGGALPAHHDGGSSSDPQRSAVIKLPPEKKGDIDPAGERSLAKYVKEKYNHDFVFLTDWPIAVRPFYHMRHPDRPDPDPQL